MIEKTKKNELELISEILIKELDERSYLLESDIVLIENQPAIKKSKNEKYTDDYLFLFFNKRKNR